MVTHVRTNTNSAAMARAIEPRLGPFWGAVLGLCWSQMTPFTGLKASKTRVQGSACWAKPRTQHAHYSAAVGCASQPKSTTTPKLVHNYCTAKLLYSKKPLQKMHQYSSMDTHPQLDVSPEDDSNTNPKLAKKLQNECNTGPKQVRTESKL